MIQIPVYPRACGEHRYQDEYYIRVGFNDVGVISCDQGRLFEDETDL